LLTHLKFQRAKFLSFTPSTSLPQEAKIKQFLEHIAPRIQDWQVEQADTAIRLYLFHFIRKDTNSIDTPGGPHPHRS
jgi:hypothetical protein